MPKEWTRGPLPTPARRDGSVRPQVKRSVRRETVFNTHLGAAGLVSQVLLDFDPNIVVLEEISARWVDELQAAMKPYPHSRIQSREDNFGIGLFSNLPLDVAQIIYIGEAGVPSIIARVEAGTRT